MRWKKMYRYARKCAKDIKSMLIPSIVLLLEWIIDNIAHECITTPT